MWGDRNGYDQITIAEKVEVSVWGFSRFKRFLGFLLMLSSRVDFILQQLEIKRQQNSYCEHLAPYRMTTSPSYLGLSISSAATATTGNTEVALNIIRLN
jgi:hypothetical protein